MEFHRNFYGSTGFKIVSFGLLLLLVTLDGVRLQSCNYYDQVQPGQTYYTYTPNYPNKYYSRDGCRWEIISTYGMSIKCTINMPRSRDCVENSLSVQIDGGEPHRYCGNGTFTVKATNAVLRLYAPSGATFLGEIQTNNRPENENPNKFDEYNCKCGWKNPTRIIGGTETGVNEYPMMAGLVDSLDRTIYCGATIISEHHVITAAHCVENRNLAQTGVVVGEHDVSTGADTDATRLFRVKRFIMHPKYDTANNINDVAICELDGAIQYNAKVGPACLPFQHYKDSFGGDIVTALGWGLKEFGGKKSNTLQKVDLNIISKMECKRYYSNVDDRNLCTYTEGKDTCQMDSGGPLLWNDPTTKQQVLVGITSYGVGCAADEPAVEVRVGSYIDWIISETQSQYCKME